MHPTNSISKFNVQQFDIDEEYGFEDDEEEDQAAPQQHDQQAHPTQQPPFGEKQTSGGDAHSLQRPHQNGNGDYEHSGSREHREAHTKDLEGKASKKEPWADGDRRKSNRDNSGADKANENGNDADVEDAEDDDDDDDDEYGFEDDNKKEKSKLA